MVFALDDVLGLCASPVGDNSTSGSSFPAEVPAPIDIGFAVTLVWLGESLLRRIALIGRPCNRLSVVVIATDDSTPPPLFGGCGDGITVSELAWSRTATEGDCLVLATIETESRQLTRDSWVSAWLSPGRCVTTRAPEVGGLPGWLDEPGDRDEVTVTMAVGWPVLLLDVAVLPKLTCGCWPEVRDCGCEQTTA